MTLSGVSLNVPRGIDEVEQHRRAVRLNPRDANTHALLGLALLRKRELDEGIASLQRALALNPKVKGLHAVLAAALFELGCHEDASAAYRQALRFQDAADLHQGLADSLVRLGRHDEAEGSARRAIALAPDNVSYLLSLTTILHKQKNHKELVALLERVLELAPDNVDVSYDLGYVLFKANRYAEAAPRLQSVLERRPTHLLASRYLSLSQRKLNQNTDAIATLEHALTHAPDDAGLLGDLGMALQGIGQRRRALDVLLAALERTPQDLGIVRALISCYFTQGEWQKALQLAREALAIAPTPEMHSIQLFILSHCCLDADELTREHFSYGERWETPLLTQRRPHTNDSTPMRRLRVGIVSGDLYNHAVATYIGPVFDVLQDSTQVELHVFYNNSVEDGVSSKLRSHVTSWHAISHLDDDAAEQLIRAEAIDILIDLSGHSALNRLPLFARKPAPVQATWMGYAGTTGLQSVDYILCDRFLVPEGRYDNQFTEKIVNLPLGAPFLPDPNAPPVNELPALSNGYLTFGSFHRASKLNRGVIAQWAKLLHAIPNAKMLLGGLQTGIDDVLVDWFEAEGIARDRLLLRERSSMRVYLEQHYDVDVCLSPFPYTGATTIGHALWMGVPTLTTVGATNPSHAAATFMAHLGLSTFIAEDEDTFVRLGAFLSQNVNALAEMRASMRERFLNTVLGYPGVVGAAMELALRKMWLRWCAGEPAAPLRVDLAELAPQTAESL